MYIKNRDPCVFHQAVVLDIFKLSVEVNRSELQQPCAKLSMQHRSEVCYWYFVFSERLKPQCLWGRTFSFSCFCPRRRSRKGTKEWWATVRPSVRPSGVSDHSLEKWSLNWFQIWCMHLLGECSELIRFWVTMAQFWPSSSKKWRKMGYSVGFRHYLKKYSQNPI